MALYQAEKRKVALQERRQLAVGLELEVEWRVHLEKNQWTVHLSLAKW
jgi:hypothetical protein